MYSKDDDESGRLFDYIFSVCLLIICLLRKKRKSVGERENKFSCFNGIIRSIDSFRFVFLVIVTVSAFIDQRKSMKKKIKATMTKQIIVIY